MTCALSKNTSGTQEVLLLLHLLLLLLLHLIAPTSRLFGLDSFLSTEVVIGDFANGWPLVVDLGSLVIVRVALPIFSNEHVVVLRRLETVISTSKQLGVCTSLEPIHGLSQLADLFVASNIFFIASDLFRCQVLNETDQRSLAGKTDT